jgi:hypothetical protein
MEQVIGCDPARRYPAVGHDSLAGLPSSGD